MYIWSHRTLYQTFWKIIIPNKKENFIGRWNTETNLYELQIREVSINNSGMISRLCPDPRSSCSTCLFCSRNGSTPNVRLSGKETTILSYRKLGTLYPSYLILVKMIPTIEKSCRTTSPFPRFGKLRLSGVRTVNQVDKWSPKLILWIHWEQTS